MLCLCPLLSFLCTLETIWISLILKKFIKLFSWLYFVESICFLVLHSDININNDEIEIYNQTITGASYHSQYIFPTFSIFPWPEWNQFAVLESSEKFKYCVWKFHFHCYYLPFDYLWLSYFIFQMIVWFVVEKASWYLLLWMVLACFMWFFFIWHTLLSVNSLTSISLVLETEVWWSDVSGLISTYQVLRAEANKWWR